MATARSQPNLAPAFSAHDRRLLAAFAESRLLGGRPRASHVSPMERGIAESAGNLGENRVECAILEALVTSALVNLHSVEESLAYWDAKAKVAHPRKLYFMTFERGPKAFVEVACQALQQLRNPYKFLIDSGSQMNHLIAERRDALIRIQRCLAKFLSEIYHEVDKSKARLHENSTNPLLVLFTIVNKLFRNLALALEMAVSKDPGGFERLALVDVEISSWSVNLATDTISVIGRNIQKFDCTISSELFLHRKPRHVSQYWLPYTCGAIAFAGCSIWLLRRDGAIDIENWFQGVKKILTGIWDAHLEKPIISIRDELADSYSGQDRLAKRRQEVQIMEDSYTRSLSTFCKNTSNQNLPAGLSDSDMLEHLIKSQEKKLSGADNYFEFWSTFKMAIDPNIYRGLLIKINKHALDVELELFGISEKLQNLGLDLAILEAFPAIILFAVIVWALQARGRRAVAERKKTTRVLVAKIEKDIKAFERLFRDGKHDEACCRFGLMLYKLDNLSSFVEPHASRLKEWEEVIGELKCLARPQATSDARSASLKSIRRTYQSTRFM